MPTLRYIIHFLSGRNASMTTKAPSMATSTVGTGQEVVSQNISQTPVQEISTNQTQQSGSPDQSRAASSPDEMDRSYHVGQSMDSGQYESRSMSRQNKADVPIRQYGTHFDHEALMKAAPTIKDPKQVKISMKKMKSEIDYAVQVSN